VASACPSVPEVAATERELDPESAAWVEALGAGGRVRDETVARLHELLLRVARSEARRPVVL
jgi:hypothetical protein